MAFEQYVNNVPTTLNGSITAGSTSLVVTSAAAMPATGIFRLLIDSELMIVTAVAGATLTVTRGAEGTTAASHNNGAAVNVILTAAALQALLAVGSVSDLTANLPTAGVAGRLFLPTDGFSLQRDSGSSWSSWGPLNPLVPTPLAASLTAVNVTTATIADSKNGLSINAANIGSTHGQFWVKSLAAGAYTWSVRLDCILLNSTFTAAGLVLRDSAGGKIITFEQNVFGGLLNFAVVQWSDANTRSVNALNLTGQVGGLMPWMRIKDDAANRTYSLSRDGLNWFDLLTEARTTYLGVAPNQAGLVVCAAGQATALSIYSWNGA